jgi:hypothetical protein
MKSNPIQGLNKKFFHHHLLLTLKQIPPIEIILMSTPIATYHLPTSLQTLIDLDFYLDHINSMIGFVRQMHTLGMCEIGMNIVETVATGFLKSRAFDPWRTMEDCPDNDLEFTRKWRSAVAEIHQIHNDRLPVQFYQVLLWSGIRPQPQTEVKMPEVEHLLPDGMTWQVGDGVEHSLPLCTRLFMGVQTILFKHTGTIMVHGCGCGSCAPTLCADAVINVPMSDRPGVGLEETESVTRHFMAQLLLLNWNLPHSIGPSMTAQMIDLRNVGKKPTAAPMGTLVSA